MKTFNSSHAIRLAVVLLALSALAAAYGQTSNVIRVTVPFQFRAGQELMPAGDYILNVDPVYGRATLSSADAGMRYLPGRAVYGTATENSRLVFHEYGNARFLRTVEFGGGSLRYRLPESRAERELAKLASHAEVALLRK